MVGCVRSRLAVKSQMQMGVFAFHNEAIIVSRVGSERAFMSVAVSSAHVSSTSGNPQHTPRSRTTGKTFIAMRPSYCIHRHLSMGHVRIPPIDNHRWEGPTMSGVREAVRSRYANVAKQIALTPIRPLNARSGCCQADGPDCGCSGSYAADDLDSMGLTESGSLGCGKPTLPAQLQPGQ